MGYLPRILAALLISLIPVPGLAQAAGPPAFIVSEGSTSFSIVEGHYYSMRVIVEDADHNPVPFPVVAWNAPATGPRATLTPYEDGGEEYGQSSVAIRAAGGFGTYQLTATVAGLPPLVFTVTNIAQQLRVVAGSHQSTLINTAFAQPLTVEARAVDGSPLAGVTLVFTPRASGQSAMLDATSMLTDANGRATVHVTANGIRGTHDVLITGVPGAEAATASFSNLLVTPAQVLRGSNASFELRVGGNSEAPRVQVYDINSLPLRGVAVQFQGPATGAGLGEMYDPLTGRPAFAVPGGGRTFTDSSGVATLEAYANDEAGTYAVEATVDGSPSVITFTVTNRPRTISAIRPNGADPDDLVGEQAPVGGRFEPLRFRVLDSEGLPMPNVALTLTPPASGPSVSLVATTVVTGADGFAVAEGTANFEPGSYFLRAEAAGFSQPASMYMLNMPPGYSVGEQLADISAFDEGGSLRSLRAFTNNGRFLLLDVCTVWCSVCQNVQAEGQQMKAQLAAMGIQVTLVPMLVESVEHGPSSQLDALTWRNTYGITDPVLHASSDPASPVVGAGAYILGANRPGYPTFLLVAPGGEIVDHHRGQFQDAADMVDFVLAHLPSSISIGSVFVDEGAGSATLTVSRSSLSGNPTVSYTTAAGSANGADFSSRSGQLQFAPGAATAVITVPIANDTMDEPAEQFTVKLSNPMGATIATATATVTIVDNDAPPAVSVADTRLTEGTGTINTALVAVSLNRASAFAITATYRLVAGTAKSTDFTLSKGEVSFSAGNTVAYVAVDLIADKTSEAKETFTIELVDAKNATLGAAVATVSIVDDDGDTLPPVIEAKSDVVLEVKMAATGSVLVDYKIPAAKDANDGVVPVSCAAPSGSKFGMGTTLVNCTAEDRAGHLAVRAFNVIVRLPTVAGAIFDPQDRTTPLTTDERGDTVLVHVNPGAFASRATVTLTFIDEKGRRHDLGQGNAGSDGSLDAMVDLPPGAARGLGQVLAESADGEGEYNRAWFLTLTKHTRH
jgi:hypothetical protein